MSTSSSTSEGYLTPESLSQQGLDGESVDLCELSDMDIWYDASSDNGSEHRPLSDLSDDESVTRITLQAKALQNMLEEQHAQSSVEAVEHDAEIAKLKDELSKASERNVMLEKELQDTQDELQQTKNSKQRTDPGKGTEQNHAVARQNLAIANQNHVIAKQNTAIARQNTAFAMNNLAPARKYSAAISHDNDVAKRELIIKQLEEKIRYLESKVREAHDDGMKLAEISMSSLNSIEARLHSAKTSSARAVVAASAMAKLTKSDGAHDDEL